LTLKQSIDVLSRYEVFGSQISCDSLERDHDSFHHRS
jgi:hypothetical protein